jgi:exodeoxyribonuclease V alpha subunit
MKMSNLLASGWRGTSLTPLSDLDIALAHLLQNLQPSTDERHLWLAALASHQWGRGHACLDLNQWPDNAGYLLAWSPQALAALPAKLALGLVRSPLGARRALALGRARQAPVFAPRLGS